VYVGELNEKVR